MLKSRDLVNKISLSFRPQWRNLIMRKREKDLSTPLCFGRDDNGLPKPDRNEKPAKVRIERGAEWNE